MEKRYRAVIPVNDPVKKRGPASSFQAEYCDQIRMLGQEGKFPEEWVAEIGATLSTLYHWANTFPEFEQAMHEAHWLCRAHWAKKARETVIGQGQMPATVLALLLERRFPDMWGKQSINMHAHFEKRNESEDGEPNADISGERMKEMTDEEIEAQIKIYMDRREHEGK